ncbi:RAF proto-oncogene serine/threonine-protein kinase-like [Patiria miniata]|uniref:Protein kinase domain-containing protein n=1 Tax=Patiria miniata TaxID=46514 RepID=A0A913ZAR8_PATMI|nr:RAF proto-oncogene serine/threonine-protein kinase-like [Patiria miniata]
MARMQEVSFNESGKVNSQTTSTNLTSKCAVPSPPDHADMKMKKKKLSGLRRAIRAIFKSKERKAANPSPEIKASSSEMPTRLEKEMVEDVAIAATVESVDEESVSSSSQCSSASDKSLETGTSPSKQASSTPPPPQKSPPAPRARASPRPKKSPSQDKPKKSGFYMYNGYPSYLGSRLYQCSDIEPELDILGQWVEVGSGETGTVHLVRIPSESNKLVAAKIIQGHDPEARFQKEVDALHITDSHPSFPQLIGVVEQSPFRCILEEFVGNDFIPESITLEDVLSNQKVAASDIPHSDWFQIARDIADGINYFHKLEYLHVNLKPENILLYATDGNWKGWRAKICDLGDCTFARLPPTIHSTPEIQAAAKSAAKPFVAPEVLRDATPFTLAADVYAFGRILRAVGKRAKIASLRHIGKKCARKTAHKRPSIDKVCSMLKRPSSPK